MKILKLQVVLLSFLMHIQEHKCVAISVELKFAHAYKHRGFFPVPCLISIGEQFKDISAILDIKCITVLFL